MMRNKIRLDTTHEAREFVDIVSQLPGTIVVKDPTGLCVNAKSILGALHAMEFSELWLESEFDIYMKIEKFIIIE